MGFSYVASLSKSAIWPLPKAEPIPLLRCLSRLRAEQGAPYPHNFLQRRQIASTQVRFPRPGPCRV